MARDHDTNEQRDIERYRETSRVIRWLVVAATVCVCVWRICDVAIVQIVNTPAWLEFALALFAPTGLILVLIRRFRRYTKFNDRMIKEMQTTIDPSRTSTGLLPDGTNPPEDRV